MSSHSESHTPGPTGPLAPPDADVPALERGVIERAAKRAGQPSSKASSKGATKEHGATTRAARDVPRPIGPERLRRLRELIESGAYPSDEDVAGGLERLFDRS